MGKNKKKTENANYLERERVNQMVINFKPNKHSLRLQGRFIGENMNGLKNL